MHRCSQTSDGARSRRPIRVRRRLPRSALRAKVIDKTGERGAGLFAAVESAPGLSYAPDERVAIIDGNPEILDAVDGAAHEDGLHIRGEISDQRVPLRQVLPRAEVKLAFGGTAGARVATNNAVEL